MPFVIPYAEWSGRRRHDGRYAYFNLIYVNSAPAAYIVRYDLAPRLHEFFGVDELQPDDGRTRKRDLLAGDVRRRYVYFPNTSGKIVQLDPQLAFTTSAAWKVFDATTVDADAKDSRAPRSTGATSTSRRATRSRTARRRWRGSTRQGAFTKRGFVDDDHLAQFASPQAFSGAGGFAFDDATCTSRRTSTIRRARSASTCERRPRCRRRTRARSTDTTRLASFHGVVLRLQDPNGVPGVR